MAVIANDTYAERAIAGTLGARADSTPIWESIGSNSSAETSALTSKSTNYTLTRYDEIVLVDATAGVRTITLPTAVGIKGATFTIKKMDNSNNVVVQPSGGQTIEAAANKTITTQYASITIASDGSNWVII